MNYQKLIDAYTERLDSYISEIERICQLPRDGNRPEFPVSPRYLDEVIIPVYESLSEYLQKNKRKIVIPDPKTYRPIKEYYRVKVGLTTVGGFSVPDGQDFSVYFTPLKSAVPVGERLKVENEEQLGEIILNQLKIHREL